MQSPVHIKYANNTSKLKQKEKKKKKTSRRKTQAAIHFFYNPPLSRKPALLSPGYHDEFLLHYCAFSVHISNTADSFLTWWFAQGINN